MITCWIRVGHPSVSLLHQMFHYFVSSISSFHYKPCQFSKHCNRSGFPFSIVYSDVWGPSTIVSLSGYKYFIIIIDNFSRATWVYLLKNKSDVCVAFKYFHSMIVTQFNDKISILHSNNRENISRVIFLFFLNESRIVHQTTCRSTSEQNGVTDGKIGIYLR